MMLKPGFMTRFFTAVRLGLGLALVGTPLITHAQVSEATRARVAELQKDPNFKLKGSARKCMSGELLGPDCDEMVQLGIKNHLQNVELAKLNAEKARLDGEKTRLDGEKARLDGEQARLKLVLVVQSHVGGAINLVDTMNYALLQTPENGLRKEYLTSRLPADVVQFITDILAKVDTKRSITQSDLREFDTLYQVHTRKAEQLIKDNPQLGNIKSKDHLLRIQIAYTTVRPRYDAAVSR